MIEGRCNDFCEQEDFAHKDFPAKEFDQSFCLTFASTICQILFVGIWLRDDKVSRLDCPHGSICQSKVFAVTYVVVGAGSVVFIVWHAIHVLLICQYLGRLNVSNAWVLTSYWFTDVHGFQSPILLKEVEYVFTFRIVQSTCLCSLWSRGKGVHSCFFWFCMHV